MLEVVNKYGKVHITTWQKDSVSIQILFLARAKNEVKLTKLVASVDFEFDHSADYITAKTHLLSSSSLSSDIKKIIDASETENEVTINYKISCPSYVKLQINNKYGDIYLDDRDTDTEITLAHGDLKSTNFTKNLRLKLSFGKATIRNMHNGKFDLAYCNRVKIKSAKKLVIDSKYSDIEIEELQTFVLTSKRDDVSIENIKTFKVTSSQSKFHITNLDHELKLDARFGSLYVETLDANFIKFNIRSRFTDLDNSLAPTTSCLFNFEHKNVDLDLPTQTKDITKTIVNSEKKPLYKTTAKLGNNKTHIISINAESSTLIISKQ